MNDFEELDLAEQKRIDLLCDEFESGLVNQTGTPTIRECLSSVVSGSAKQSLFAELVYIDLENRPKSERHERFEQLRQIFPEHKTIIENAELESLLQYAPRVIDETPTAHSSEIIRETHKTIGQYKLVECVGSGAFGNVWKATDSTLNRTVAIKIPRKDCIGEEELLRFHKEAQLAAQLKHSNIITVHEIQHDADTPFIVSDYIDGQPISRWGERPLNIKDAASLCITIADALHHAHECGVVHRDLKPSNILIDRQGQPQIADFGLAKSLTDETMTLEGNLLGSPAYMSPEQAAGDSFRADHRSDVYSIGVVLYELLTGERPFRGSPEAVLHQVVYDEPASPRTLNQTIPLDVETICLKCLEKEPAKRYESAELLADDLRHFERGEPIAARPVSQSERVGRWCKRNPSFASAIGLSSTLLLLLAVTGPWLAVRETKRAERNRQAAVKRERERATARRQASLRALSETQNAFIERGARAALPLIKRERQQGDSEVVSGFPFNHLVYQANHISHRTYSTNAGHIVVSPNDELLVLGEGKQLVVRDLDSGHEVSRFDMHGASAFSRDGTKLAIGNAQGIHIFDIRSGELEQTFDLAEYYSHEPLDDGVVIAPLDAIHRLSWSFDDGWIAYNKFDGPPARVLNCSTGKTLILGKGNNHDSQYIVTLSFSPVANELATGGFDGSVRVWSIETGKQLTHYPVPNDWVRDVCYSRDGQMLAITDDNNLYVRKRSSGEFAGVIAADRAWSVAFSPDGQYVACGNWTGTVNVYNVATPRDVYTLRGHGPAAKSVKFSANGSLVSLDNTATMNVFSWGTVHGLSNRIVRYDRGVKSISISPDETYAAAVGDDAIVTVTNIDTRQRLHEFSVLREDLNPSRPPSYGLDFNPVSERLELAVAAKHEVVVWTEGHEELRHLPLPMLPNEDQPRIAYPLQYTPDGSYLVCGDGRGSLWYWDTTDWKRSRWEIAKNKIGSLKFSCDGRMAVSFVGNGMQTRLCFLDLRRREFLVAPFNSKSSRIVKFDFSPDGSELVTNSREGGLAHIWDSRTGMHLRALNTNRFRVVSVAYEPSGDYVALGTGTIGFWETEDWSRTMSLDIRLTPIYVLEFAPSGKFLLSGDHNGSVRIWRARK